jgi:uncharacterized membrane protein YqgA involved in biofilm formation
VLIIGPLVNAAAIVGGVGLGLAAGTRLSPAFRERALRALGIVVLTLGLKMLWPLLAPVGLLLALVSGLWLGDAWHVQPALDALGNRAEHLFTHGGFARGFVPATLIFNVGALAVVGSIQAGLGHPPLLLYTKSVLDGVTAMVLTTTLGWGVVGAAPVTLCYEGGLALGASAVQLLLPHAVLALFSEAGGVLVAAIGVNFLADRPLLPPGALLPTLLVAPLLGWLGVAFHIPLL